MKIERILIAGSSGLVGSAILRRLQREGTFEILSPNRHSLDLQNSTSVKKYLEFYKPDTVILAAAKVGGIAANQEHPVAFLTDNLEIQNNVMLASQQLGVKNFMFLGSSCIYPRNCPQPMKESDFMTGPLEPTNASYAIAKIAGIRLAEALKEEYGMRIVLPMPCNVYGPGDHFDLEKSHVLSALVARFEIARRSDVGEVLLWGTGTARREFIHCDDLADACLFLLQSDKDLGIINVGSGKDLSILELANTVRDSVGYQGTIKWDLTKPDGMPRKLLDVTRLEGEGWSASIRIEAGIDEVVAEYRQLFPA